MANNNIVLGLLLGAVLLVAFAPSFAAAQTTYSLSGNYTANDPDGTLKYRTISTYNNTVGDVWGFESVSVTIEGFDVTIDTLAGVIEYKALPVIVLAYFDASETITDPTTFSVSAAKNVIAKSFFRIAEKDALGAVVTSYLAYSGGLLNTDWVVDVGSNGDLHYFNMNTTLTNNITGTSFQLGITYFVSSVVGMIDLANTPITPRMIESVVRINNYQYVNPSNYLTLDLVAAYNSESFNASTTGIVFSGSELSQAYVKVANICQLTTGMNDRTGTEASVTVHAWDSTSVFATFVKNAVAATSLGTYMTSRFDTNWGVSLGSIDFPAGASNILYDPTIGTGTSNTSAAVSLTFSSIVLALIALIAMLI